MDFKSKDNLNGKYLSSDTIDVFDLALILFLQYTFVLGIRVLII